MPWFEISLPRQWILNPDVEAGRHRLADRQLADHDLERVLGRRFRSLGRFFAPYAVAPAPTWPRATSSGSSPRTVPCDACTVELMTLRADPFRSPRSKAKKGSQRESVPEKQALPDEGRRNGLEGQPFDAASQSSHGPPSRQQA